MSNVFVFRIANDVDYVKNEIKQGRLRQGWGDSTSNLTGVSPDEWVKARCERNAFYSNYEYYSSKYRNLVKMHDIKSGDILIIPQTPDYTKFTICRASGEYTFCEPFGYNKDDYYHTIPIDVDSIREFSYHANEKCKIIHAKLRSYQSPINRVLLENVIEAAESVVSACSDICEQKTENIVKEIKDDIFKTSAISRFRNLGNRETEKIVKLIFENMGYEFICSNSYDKEGGDADLIFADNSFGELMDAGLNGTEIPGKIFIQVKNKYGTDESDIEGVKQLIKRAEDENAAIKILISTADDFTQECKDLANRNYILLIDGRGFLNLILKYID